MRPKTPTARLSSTLPVDENSQPLHADALVALEVSDPSGIPDVIGDDVDLDIPLELRSPAELQRLEAIAEKAGVTAAASRAAGLAAHDGSPSGDLAIVR